MTDQELAELLYRGMKNTVGAPARAISAGRALAAGTPKNPNATYGAIKPDHLDYIRNLLKSPGSSYRPPQPTLDIGERPQIPAEIQAMLKSDGWPPHPISESMSPYSLTPQAEPAAPLPVGAPSAQPYQEQFKPTFDLAKLVELTKQVGGTMDISHAMKEPANSMASILGVNDASYLKGLMPDEVFKLAQTRAENAYKAMLTKQQAVNIANEVTGRGTQQDLLKSLVASGISADNAMALANFNQNRQDRRAIEEARNKPETKAQMEATAWAIKLAGGKLTKDQEELLKLNPKMDVNTATKIIELGGRGMLVGEDSELFSLYEPFMAAMPAAVEVLNNLKPSDISKPTDQTKTPEISGSTSSGSRFKIKEVK